MTLSAKKHLFTLEAQGLVRQALGVPELHYLFRHALIQDAAYTSLLKTQRKQLHLLVGEALEQATPKTEEIAPLLAHHFLQAGEAQRALPYLIQAGDTAFARYANAEAAAHYGQALALVWPTLTTPAALTAPVRQLFARRGRALEWLGAYAKALQHYAETATLAQTLGDTELEFAAVSASAVIHSTANTQFDGAKAQELLAQARALAQARQDGAAEAQLLWNMLLLGMMRQQPLAEWYAYGEQALALARALDLHEQKAFILTDIWYAYASNGQWTQSQAALEEALHLWPTLGNTPMYIETLNRLCLTAFYLGQYAAALQHGQNAYDLSCTIQHADAQALTRAFYPLIYWERGHIAQALTTWEATIAQAQNTTHNLTVLVGTQSELGWCYAQLGATTQGLALAQDALTMAETQFQPFIDWPRLILGRIALRAGDIATAQAHLAVMATAAHLQAQLGFMVIIWAGVTLAQAELALAQQQPASACALLLPLLASLAAQNLKHLVVETELLLGWAYVAQAQWHLAQAAFTRAHTLATALQATWRLWQTAAALGYVAHQQGIATTAATWHTQAQTVLAQVLAHLPTPTLRQTFTALPIVQAIQASSPGQAPHAFGNAENV